MESKREYTHYAKFYGVPCYWNNETDEIIGRNKLYELLLSAMIWIECKFPSNPDGFPIEIGAKLEKDNRFH